MIPHLGAPIITFEEIEWLRPKMGKIVVVSGGYDPIHPGHISNMQEAKKLGDTLIVVVNGDGFLTKKKGKPFQDLATRSLIVSGIKSVDYVMPFEIENDDTVIQALEKIKPQIFAKGGDRIDAVTIPEWETCQKNNIEVVTGVGLPKYWSSSDFLKNWGAK